MGPRRPRAHVAQHVSIARCAGTEKTNAVGTPDPLDSATAMIQTADVLKKSFEHIGAFGR